MRTSALGLLPLLLAAAAVAAPVVETGFPKPNEVFPRLLADPRAVGVSASYYRMGGDDVADVALGHSWGLARWRTGSELSWLWQNDIEGVAYSRFRIGSGVNEFETIDFFLNLPVTVRKGEFSFRGLIFHESSHLGDDYIRRTGDAGFRYSIEGLRGLAALEPARFLRAYAGGEALIHMTPHLRPWTAHAGFELVSDDLGWSRAAPTRLFTAHDFQWRQRVGWGLDYRAVAGVKLGFRKVPDRSLRIQGGHYRGRSSYGQFFRQRERYNDFSLVFEF